MLRPLETACQLPPEVWSLNGLLSSMFENTFYNVNQVVTVEYFENGNEPMVTVGYDIYAKNISQGKELQQNLILILITTSNHF